MILALHTVHIVGICERRSIGQHAQRCLFFLAVVQVENVNELRARRLCAFVVVFVARCTGAEDIVLNVALCSTGHSKKSICISAPNVCVRGVCEGVMRVWMQKRVFSS